MRPETIRIRPERGSSPSRNARPTTLSTALCRPTSSRTASSPPPASNSPAACRPPVRSNARCAARRAPGRPRIVARSTVGPASTGPQRTATWSSVALPQTPQLDVAKKFRRNDEPSNGRESATCATPPRARQSASTTASSGPISPSVRRKPTASSRSAPGVRIVTATLVGPWPGPEARISNGSSTATQSKSSVAPAGPSTRTPTRPTSRAGWVATRRRASVRLGRASPMIAPRPTAGPPPGEESPRGPGDPYLIAVGSDLES